MYALGEKMKKIIWLLAFAMLFGNLFAGLSLGYSVTPTTVNPGGSGVVALTISNPSSTTTTVYKLNAVSLSIYSSALSSTDKFTVGDLDVGASTVISIPFTVKPTTKSGIYIMEIRVSGYTASTTSSGTSSTQLNYQTITVPVNVANSPILVLSSDKTVVKELEPIKLNISNNGGPASRIQVKINSSDFAIDGKNELYVDKIDNSAELGFILDSRDSDDGVQDVIFSLQYQNELGTSISELKTLRITVKKDKLDLDFLQKSDIITRKDSVLKMFITNTGVEIDDVRLSFSSDSIQMKEVSEVKLGDLLPNSKNEISIPIFTSLSPGVNYVDFNFKYVEKGVEKEKSISVPLTVTSDADVSVYLDAKPTPLAIGQEHTLSILVSNLGSYEISNVDVAIASNIFSSLDVQDKAYIGGLDKDDFSTVQFKIKVKDVAPGPYPLETIVNYRDKSGEWKSKLITTEIMINVPASQSNGSGIYLLLFAVLIVIGVWYFKFRGKIKSGG